MPDYHAHGYDDLSDEGLLAKVKKGWRSKETPCGAGSTITETCLIRSYLPKIAEKYGIRSVCDAGAGDLHWMPLVRWDVEYRGFDLYPRHPDVQPFDMTREVLPRADLILCRHVLNHLSIRQAEDTLARFKESGSTYLLMTMNANQADYWQMYELERTAPIETFEDTGSWWLEFSRL